MLAQLFNPAEIKKNGPATMPAIAPARRTALPFRAAPAVLPATSQSYGDARVIVNGDQRRSTMNGPIASNAQTGEQFAANYSRARSGAD